jgi:hypothetical protein
MRQNVAYRQFYDVVQALARVSSNKHCAENILKLCEIKRQIESFKDRDRTNEYKTLLSMYQAVKYADGKKVYVLQGDTFKPTAEEDMIKARPESKLDNAARWVA